MLRTFKYLRLFLLIVDMKRLWKDTHLLIVCVCKAVWKVKPVIMIWVVVVLIISLMGYHLHTGNTLLDANGDLDPQNGKPNQVSFSTFYHSLIFTLLTLYDEDCGLFLCCFCVLVFAIVIDIKYHQKLTLPTIVDLLLFVVYGVGMVY